MKILIIGIAVADIVVNPVDSFPNKGELTLVDSTQLFSGGCAINTAIDMAKLGVIPDVIAPIGNDYFGKFIKNELNAVNIDVSNLVELDTLTSTSIVLSSSDSERSFLHTLGANVLFGIENINLDLIKQADILYIAGSLIMHKLDGKPLTKILKYAKENNTQTVLDTVWDATNQWGKIINPYLPYLDIFAPSLEEAKRISNLENEEDILKHFRKLGAKNIILKLGEKGSVSYINNDITYHKATKVKAIDTTGAGDSFMAGLLTGLANNFNIHKAIKLGNIVGSHCVLSIGASTNIPKLQDIIKLVEE